jgi:DtxR family Mn-dependent transcriptional regulator
MILSKQNRSESVQMYLITVYRLREQGNPVPMPLLVDEMGLTPASINEMCRKLEKEQLLNYVPYSGVNLTKRGEELARGILRKHRIWEVFLVGNLGFDYEEAHKIACQLEHFTPEALVDRLEGFLEYPQVNPRGEPIPLSKSALEQNQSQPLLDLSPGDKAQITHIRGDKIETGYLLKNNIKPGQEVLIRAVDETSMLILNQGEHLVLSRDLADKVFIQKLLE